MTRRDGTTPEEVETLVKFLTRVRGPERAGCAAARVSAARAEPPRKSWSPSTNCPNRCWRCMTSQGDSKGIMWFTSHKTDVVGKLDPKTGIVTEYTIPLTPKAMPGTHAVRIDKHDVPWFSENWAHNLNRLDPQTGKITQVKIEDLVPLNAPGFGNFSMTDDGYVWDSRDFNVRKIDPETGKVVQRFPAAGQLQL